MTPEQVPHLVRHLLEKHGLLRRGWSFSWDNARTRAGCCKHGPQLITLSRHYVARNWTTNPDEVVDTILHEIAHALTPGHHHDDVWKAKCVEIGANPVRCYDSSVVDMPRGALSATCGGCGQTWRRHKRPRVGTFRYCGKCGPKVGRLHFKPTVTHAPAPSDVAADTPPPPQLLR